MLNNFLTGGTLIKIAVGPTVPNAAAVGGAAVRNSGRAARRAAKRMAKRVAKRAARNAVMAGGAGMVGGAGLSYLGHSMFSSDPKVQYIQQMPMYYRQPDLIGY